MLGVLFVSFLQAVAGPPSLPPAADQGPAAAASEQAAGGEDNSAQEAGSAPNERRRMRCRTEAIVGSRLGRRVCMTQAEEDAWRQDSRDYINRAQSQMPLNSN